MTRIDRASPPISTDARIAGWMVSLVLHGTLAFGAFLFLQHIKLAPQQPPFQWDVAMVAPAPQPTMSPGQSAKQSTPPASVAQSPAKPAVQPSDPPLTEPPPIEQTHIAEPLPSQPVAEQIPHPVAEQVPLTRTVETTDHPVTQTEQIPPIPPPAPPAPQPTASAPAMQPPSALRDSEQPASAPHAPAMNTPSHPASSEPVEPALATQNETDTVPQDNSPSHQVAALSPSNPTKPTKADYGWLTDLMAKWSQDLDKPYPTILRTEGIQGKVTVSALLHDDGALSHIRVAKSSGNSLLDQAAVEAVKNGPPLKLSRPLERPSILVKIPIVYILSSAR